MCRREHVRRVTTAVTVPRFCTLEKAIYKDSPINKGSYLCSYVVFELAIWDSRNMHWYNDGLIWKSGQTLHQNHQITTKRRVKDPALLPVIHGTCIIVFRHEIWLQWPIYPPALLLLRAQVLQEL